MGLFYDAANAWNALINTTFIIELGRRNKQYSICLTFEAEDFPHIAGMHYATDVDFGLRRSEYYGKNLLRAVLSGKLDESLICKSRDWPRIEGRLKAIANLRRTLQSDFIVAEFHRERVRGNCTIEAKYVIKDTSTGEAYFVFLDQRSGRYYCKSAFQSELTDYTDNQPIMTILEIKRHTPDGTTVLRRHPNYKEKRL